MYRFAIIFAILFLNAFVLNSSADAKINDLMLDSKQVKKKILFWKKEPKPKIKMVETKQEWEVESINIPLADRDLFADEKKVKTKEEIKEEKKKQKRFHVPEAKYVFEKYNYPHGKRELNIEDIKRQQYSYPYLVCDINCRYGAYARYYYSPDINQISSEFYVEKLDTSKTKQKRILDYKHHQFDRKPIIKAGMDELYPNLYRGLSLVDWNNNSKKLLIKEKVGSLNNGIYKNYLYINHMSNEVESSKTIKLTDFDETIKNYFLDYQNLQLVKYRYDIVPLGFDAQDDDVIVAHLFAYDKNNNKVFLGTWGYDSYKRQTILFSKDNPVYSLSANGLMLKQVID